MEKLTQHAPLVAAFSLVGLDKKTGDVGVAVASKFLAMGSIVPWAHPHGGAVATQALANASFGPKALGLMRAGATASDALSKLLEDDAGRERRQVGLVDLNGGSAAHTGSGCQKWAGHRVGEGFACQGNILTGEQTIESMVHTFHSVNGLLGERLIAALKAGEEAGGDRRGRQSACAYVVREKGGYGGLSNVVLDLRVDDDTDPIKELRRLMRLHNLYFKSGPPSEKVRLDGDVLAELKVMMRKAGVFTGEGTAWDQDVRDALDAFLGAENLEERVDLDERTIDQPALIHLRRRLLGFVVGAGFRMIKKALLRVLLLHALKHEVEIHAAVIAGLEVQPLRHRIKGRLRNIQITGACSAAYFSVQSTSTAT
jgi:uncharacterized Ntn-hydrolase superfamily protein